MSLSRSIDIPEICYVLDHITGLGNDQMAWDEVLVEMARQTGQAFLRTYSWSPATLSLGYFQSSDVTRQEPTLSQKPVVRRRSGGGAIWHDSDLTYALALPATHPAGGRPADLYRVVHGTFVELLAQRGIVARRRGCPGKESNLSKRPFLCFTDHDSEDILVQDAKVLGSSQRRHAGVILQHGSLLLQTSESLPNLLGIDILCGVTDSVSVWSQAVTELLPRRLNLDAVFRTFDEGWFSLHSEWLDRFSKPDWINRRS